MKATLDEIREALHAYGSYSSRHDALDDLNKIIFAHFSSPNIDLTGIDEIDTSCCEVECLRSYVKEAFDRLLPDHIRKEIDHRDLNLAMRDTDAKFAERLIHAFRHLSLSSIGCKTGLETQDYANELFGHFMSDSFSDEKNMGQYMTPIDVVKFVSGIAAAHMSGDDLEAIAQGKRYVLDPSCGTSSFLTEFLRRIDQNLAEHVCNNGIVGFDKSPRMTMFSLTSFALRGMHPKGLHRINSVTDRSPTTVGLEGKCSIIMTNPPFGAEFPISEVNDQYEVAGKWYKGKAKFINSEILLMERYAEWLCEGGAAYVVVPDSILYNKGIFEDLRRGLSSRIVLENVVSLPPVTFAATGTSTKTSILHFRKKRSSAFECYFAVCSDIGYEVSTRGANRQIIKKGQSELPDIQAEILRQNEANIGKRVRFRSAPPRWDAPYHVNEVDPEILRDLELRVRDVARLVVKRLDPRKLKRDSFEYVEIGSVDSENLTVSSKELRCEDAPSRARKSISPGHLLVSTVRPERRVMGVVPPHMVNVIASTGFAVLECTDIDPYLLGKLLQSDFCNSQVARNNAGISYPAVDETVFLEVILPVKAADLARLSAEAQAVREAFDSYKRLSEAYRKKLPSAGGF